MGEMCIRDRQQIVIAILNGNANAIGVRIGCKQQIRVNLLAPVSYTHL